MDKNTQQVIAGPVYYDQFGQYIFDKNNNMVAEVRGYGHLSAQYGEESADKLQDEMGRFIANAINEKLQHESQRIVEEAQLAVAEGIRKTWPGTLNNNG